MPFFNIWKYCYSQRSIDYERLLEQAEMPGVNSDIHNLSTDPVDHPECHVEISEVSALQKGQYVLCLMGIAVNAIRWFSLFFEIHQNVICLLA